MFDETSVHVISCIINTGRCLKEDKKSRNNELSNSKYMRCQLVQQGRSMYGKS